MPDLTRKLPDWLKGYMLYTENTEPPTLFRKWTGISCIASAMQRKIRVDWGPSLTWYPNLYIVLVGPSATGKGTAMNAGFDIISKIPSVKTAPEATSLQALISNLKDNNLTDFNPETGEHAYHSSMTIFSEEFTVFLGYHNSELMSTLCNWYDCREKWEYDTIKRSKEKIHGVWVNLIGGTTPDLIRSSLPYESIGGGLTSRIIFIYEEKPEKLVTMPTATDKEKHLYDCLVQDLEKISLLSGSFNWTEGFMRAWDTWCREDRINPPFRDPKFDGYNGRRRVHLMKLSMIVNTSHGQHDLILSEDDLIDAANILAEAEKKMALTFKGVGRSDIADLMFRANMFLMASKTDELSYREFARYFESDADKPTLDRLLDTLEAVGTAVVIKRPGADSIVKILRREVN
uniref:Putative primase n=1 Tax=viral metagenome TaxID=1070528 RepID=A0A6H1ZC01_9ZZZZ